MGARDLVTLTLRINGTTHSVDADPDTPLVYVLRDLLGLKGTKLGCGLEQCGACAVLADGKVEMSCVTAASAFEGKEITTIEGIAGDDTGRRVQQAFVETSAAETVWIDQQPFLQNALSQPLSGEPRVAYCQVRPRHAAGFEDYVQTHLADAVELHCSQTLLDRGWFGPGVPDPRVQDRIGDYTLVGKGNHVIKDTVHSGGMRADIGVHGGISEDELRVPLLAVVR